MANLERNPIIRRTGKREAWKAAEKSERAEHMDVLEQEGISKPSTWEGHLPKVVLSAEAQRDRERAEKEEHLSSLMKRMHPEERGEWVPLPVDIRPAKEREWAERRMNAFKRRLQERTLTEGEMDGFGEEFLKMKENLERFQATNPEQENFKTIEQLEAAVHASKLTPRDARYELTYHGATAVELETEEKGETANVRAAEYAERITTRYGVGPEELETNNGSFFAKLKYKWDLLGTMLLRSTARLSGMNPEGMRRLRTDLEKWREAQREIQSGELARNERLPQARKQRTSVEERKRRESDALELVKARASLEEERIIKDRAFAKEVLGDRARVLFDEINDRMEFLQGENAERFSFTPEAYVINAANYLDASTHQRKGGIKEYGATLHEMNKDLGWPADLDPRFPRVSKSIEETRIEEPTIAKRRSSRRRIPEQKTFQPMTVEKAQTILPDAHGFWEFVKAAYVNASKDVQDRLMQIGKQDGITNYVLLTAQVLEAAQKNIRTPATAEALTLLNILAKDLGIPADKLGVVRGQTNVR